MGLIRCSEKPACKLLSISPLLPKPLMAIPGIAEIAQLLFGDIHGDINRRRLQCFDENPGFCAGTGAKPD